ncbi:MAG: hypothetical protein PF961_16710 [Planctomycetota bacterium]|nr:hypothetical protein [Planctomycetota bacterium]
MYGRLSMRPSSGAGRRGRPDGACHLEVTPRANGLRLSTPHLAVTVLGTALTLEAHPASSAVTVEHGRVAVTAAGHERIVVTGMRVSANAARFSERSVVRWTPDVAANWLGDAIPGGVQSRANPDGPGSGVVRGPQLEAAAAGQSVPPGSSALAG